MGFSCGEAHTETQDIFQWWGMIVALFISSGKKNRLLKNRYLKKSIGCNTVVMELKEMSLLCGEAPTNVKYGVH